MPRTMTQTTPKLALSGKVLIFGGPYGNLQATQRLFEEAERLGVPAGHILCSGDIVAYCAAPQECVDLLRERGVFSIMGNCEESLGADAEDCGCGFDEGSLCEVLSRQWYDFCRSRLDRESKRWMAVLPRQALLEIGGRRLLLVHGAPDAISRFVFPSTPWQEKAAAIAAAGVEGIVGGHSGLPFAQLAGDRLWLNSGALGMPANDATARGWFALLEEAPKGLTITLHALTYDQDAAAAQMAERGLKTGYAECLETGLWPSLDVLPNEERAATGRPLSEQRLFWPKTAVAN
jgi:predicted phosphodiesterase